MSDKIKEYRPIAVPGEPDSAEFQNPVAYRLAFILKRHEELSMLLTPEELFWLAAAPQEIERLQKLLLDISNRLPTPGLFISPPPPEGGIDGR